MEPIDAVVVGGGPAGLAAALWLGRYRRSTILVDADEPRNRWVQESHGYLGFDCTSPGEIKDRALADLKRYPTVTVRSTRINHAEREDDVFVLHDDEGPLHARSVIVATGVRELYPEVANLFDHYGRSVFTCPTCDGYETQGKRVVLIGWTDDLVVFAEHLLEWASSVTIVTDGPRFEGRVPPRDPIAVIEEDAVEFVGEPGDLRGVRMRDGTLVECEVAFFHIGQEPASEILTALGADVTPDGCAVADDKGRTSVPNLYAAGDVTEAPQLIQVAAASGAVAGLTCAKHLRRRR